jgi:hypothetical protein
MKTVAREGYFASTFAIVLHLTAKVLGASPEAFDRSKPLIGVADPGPASTRPATTKPKRASGIEPKKDSISRTRCHNPSPTIAGRSDAETAALNPPPTLPL